MRPTTLARDVVVSLTCLSLACGTSITPLCADSLADPPPNWRTGTLTGTLTTSAPGPEYIVYGDVTVPQGATLTLEPGVTLTFLANSDYEFAGTHRNLAEFIINGELIATGNTQATITLRSSSSTPGSWAGLRVNGQATLNNVAIRDGLVGLTNHGIANVSGCSLRAGVECWNGVLNIASSTVYTTGYGVRFFPATSGSVKGCQIFGESGSTGLLIYGSVSTTPDDTLSASPTVISGFTTAVGMHAPGELRNLLLVDNYADGIRVNSANVSVTYCTIVGSATAIWDEWSVNRHRNCIIAFNGIATDFRNPAIGLDHSVLWESAIGSLGSPGSHVAYFDPGFINVESGDYRLATTSLFTNYSNSGGEIGAYGPGFGSPTNAYGVEVVNAGYRDGAVWVTWRSEGGGAARVLRRQMDEEWKVVGLGELRNRDEIEFRDAEVVAGETYEYGVATLGDGGVGVAGRVAVSVPRTPVALGIAISPNPYRRSGSLSLALHLAEASKTAVSVVDVAGRVIIRKEVGVLTGGSHKLSMEMSDRLTPGMYFVRVATEDKVAIKSFVVLE